MPDYEFKVLKMPHNRQEFYSNFLRSFGWQVQSLQETVESVVNQSFGTSTNTGSGFMSGTINSIPRINHAHLSGHTWNTGFGTQSSMGVTRVNSVLSVTYARDLALPSRDRLAWLEQQCWPHVNAYFARVDAAKTFDTNWTEWQMYAWLSRRGQNLMTAGTESLPPAKAVFLDLKTRHGVTRGALPGVEFHLALTVDNRKNLNCQVVVYFLDEKGNHLADADKFYGDGQRRVATTAFIKPSYDGSRWDDLDLFIPYDQLHLAKSRQTVQYYAAVRDISGDSVIAKTNVREFAFLRRLLGKIEASELTPGGVQTIGNAPAAAPPARPAPAPAPKPAGASPVMPAAAAPAPASKPAAPAPAAQPAAPALPPRAPLSDEERDRRAMAALGWTEVTEDRRLYLEAQRAKTLAARQKGCKAALKLNPKEAAYWVGAALDPKTGIYDAKVLEEGLRAIPGAWMLTQAQATAFLQTGRLDRARAIIDGLSPSASDPAERRGALILQALVAEQDKDYAKAIKLHDQADALVTDPEARPYLIGHHQKRLRELMAARR